MSDEDAPEQEARPVLRIVRGAPDDTEIAAVTAALIAATSGQAEPVVPAKPLSVWADRSAGLRHPAGRRPLRPGPGAWRASALPR